MNGISQLQAHTAIAHNGLSTFEHYMLVVGIVVLWFFALSTFLLLRRIAFSVNQHTIAWTEWLKRDANRR